MLADNEKSALASGAWFAGLAPDTGAAISNALSRRTVRSGDALFRQGDPASGLHVLLSGEGRITGSSVDGIPALIGILRAGDWTGFLAVLDGGPYAFSAEMVTEGVAACLPVAAVENIFGSDVGTFRMLVAPELTIARRNYHFFLETHGRPPLRRVAERLMSLGRWPYAAATGPLAALEHVSQEDLAAATRLSRQRINTALRDLQQRGLINHGYGQVTVIDPAGLGRIAAGLQ